MNSDHGKTLIDAGSFATMAATFAGWLPHIAAALTIIWTGIRIYESKTVQKLLGRGP
jgi:hypothetical protein